MSNKALKCRCAGRDNNGDPCNHPLAVANPAPGADFEVVSCWCGKSGVVWRTTAGELRFDGYIVPECDDPGPPRT